MKVSMTLFVFILITTLFILQTSAQTLYACNRNASCGCSRNPATLSRIVGGEAANNATWGWAVSISIAAHSLCGGSILSQSWIISAAHCFDGYSASDLFIYAGSNNRWSGTQNRTVSRIIMHSGYDSMTFENDIALLELSNPLWMNDSNINAICLPPIDEKTQSTTDEWPPANTPVVAVGWGRLATNGLLPSTLQQVTVHTVDRRSNACASIATDWRVQLCAGIPDSGRDTCQGDSGGPLMLFNSNRQWILVGLTSTGAECASSLFTGVYTRVSAFNQWILLNTGASLVTTTSTTERPVISYAHRGTIIVFNIFISTLWALLSVFRF